LSKDATGKAKPVPHLTSFTLESILTRAGTEYESFPLPSVWDGSAEPEGDDFDAVLISTTFIWDRHSLEQAIKWAYARYPKATLILGGQYSNLKYMQILNRHPEVFCVVRGDGEDALPRLVTALRTGGGLGAIPNLVVRDPHNGRVRVNQIGYIDLDAYPSPSPVGEFPIVPYESMRGCPFKCGFCSFPHASPQWRYKSARKIRDDWARYAECNGAVHIRASDSTFTTPPTRLRELLELLPDLGIGWEAFARANALKDQQTVDALVAAHCQTLSIGFESMSPNTLKYMNKQVTAKANRNAFGLLKDSDLGYRISFMIGYPGETPEDYQITQNFLTQEYAGYFMLNVFSMQDETMPVWSDAEEFGLHLDDPDDPDQGWVHRGMNLGTARGLHLDTLEKARWHNDRAVHLLWQKDYETPMVPHRTARQNLWLEKLVERVAMLLTRESSPTRVKSSLGALLAQLAAEGVTVDDRIPVGVGGPATEPDLGF
jgi:anaerobic magnesium-protoporphyrin IX monomethyl ester cyclase